MTSINWQQRAKETDLGVRNFINGNYVDCQGDQTIVKQSPRDGSLLYEFLAGDDSEINLAVSCSREAFNDGRWSRQSVHQRKSVLYKLMALIEMHKEEFALYDCLDVGKPISNVLNDDIPTALLFLKSYIEGADKLLSPSASDGGSFAYQLRKPVGVVGAIIGWNFPLFMAIMKMAPALLMGNSVVLKPSEFSPLSACRLAALALEAGVPPGVFNVVNGVGATVGKQLAHHPDVDLLSFTGSSVTGKQMMLASGQSNMKRLMLECGGKSPYIVFDDCPHDLDYIASNIVYRAFHNQGEWCVAGTRLLIQESIKKRLLPKVLEQAEALKPQDPLDPVSTFGALIHEAHMNKVLGYIDSGKQQGAKLVLGGQRVNVNISDSTGQGYYVEPTIFDRVNAQQKIAQEEIFGPVLSVLTFKDEAEAISLANNSCYGLAAYAATENLGRAQRLSQGLNCGFLAIVGASKPTGGYVLEIAQNPHRQSGFGSEMGMSGLASYTATTATHLFT